VPAPPALDSPDALGAVSVVPSVCNVYVAPDGETVCGAARSAVKQDRISTLELLGALGLRARDSVPGSSECLT
jgi:hypothetical protein